MTEQEARDAIQRWCKYARLGDPTESDYGDGRPSGIIAAGLESRYRSPQIWHAPEVPLVATKADYDLIEAVYQGLQFADKQPVKRWYFQDRPFSARPAVERFMNRVMAL